MLPIRNISNLSPMCCNFWEKCINSHKIGQGCSTPLSLEPKSDFKVWFHLYIIWGDNSNSQTVEFHSLHHMSLCKYYWGKYVVLLILNIKHHQLKKKRKEKWILSTWLQLDFKVNNHGNVFQFRDTCALWWRSIRSCLLWLINEIIHYTRTK